MGRSIGYESLLEESAIYHFEFSAQIASYQEQPEKTEFWVEGKRQIYFPDFELMMVDGEVVYVEVKPEAKLKDPVLKKRLEDIAEHYRQRGYRFVVLTDKQLKQEPLLGNLKQLIYHHRWERDDQELRAAMEALTLLPAHTVDGFKAVLGNVQDVYRLLATGFYVCDLSRPIEGSTEIQKATKENCYVAIHI
jgi:hypothetical protein